MTQATAARRIARPATVAEAAKAWGISPKTVRRWIAQGRLTGYRLGPRVLRVDLDELDAIAQAVPTTQGR